MANQQEREAAKRKEKLEQMREQIDDGSLKVREMTDEDRERFPRRPESERPKRAGRRR